MLENVGESWRTGSHSSRIGSNDAAKFGDVILLVKLAGIGVESLLTGVIFLGVS
jgi:hypothetical protein